jgi:hypothetical protein
VLQSMLNSSASSLLDSGSSGRPFASSDYSAQSGTTPFVHHGGEPCDSLSQCGLPGGLLLHRFWVVSVCSLKTLKLVGAASCSPCRCWVRSVMFVVCVSSLGRALARARERAMRTTMNAVAAVTEVFMGLLWLFGRLIFGLCPCAGLTLSGLCVHVFYFPSILGGMLTSFDDRVATLRLFMFDCFRE